METERPAAGRRVDGSAKSVRVIGKGDRGRRAPSLGAFGQMFVVRPFTRRR
ncbi:MAG: hypothetical protein RKO66_15055 [Candidatus Contendobacter sp.]|nr:hypothetical protein [Candidatus Contendobacter sp.]